MEYIEFKLLKCVITGTIADVVFMLKNVKMPDRCVLQEIKSSSILKIPLHLYPI